MLKPHKIYQVNPSCEDAEVLFFLGLEKEEYLYLFSITKESSPDSFNCIFLGNKGIFSIGCSEFAINNVDLLFMEVE